MSVSSNRDNRTLVNMDAAQLAAQIANLAAQLEFQKERFKLLEMPQFKHLSMIQLDELAFKKSQSVWENTFKESSLTGTYQGKPTSQWLTEQAQLTGVFNGQQTLQGKLTDAQIAQMTQSILNTQRLTDLEYQKLGENRRQYDTDHALKLRESQASLTGTIDGLPTFERQQWEAAQGQQYLELLSTLRGPENAFKQLEVLQNTPQGLLQMARNWAGVSTGGAAAFTATAAPTRATVRGLLADPTQPSPEWSAPPQWQPASVSGPGQQTWGMPTTIAGTAFSPIPQQPSGQGQGVVLDPTTMQPMIPQPMIPQPVPTEVPTYGGGGTPGGGELGISTQPGYTIDPPGVQAPVQAYNYQPNLGGSQSVYPPGVPAPATNAQVSTSVPVSATAESQMIAQATGQPTPYQYQPSAMVAPSQINARNYNKATDYEKRFGWARYEAEGWDKEAAQQVYAKSLPKYGFSNSRPGQTGTVRI